MDMDNNNDKPIEEKKKRTMQRGLKITLISLGSLLGLVVVVVAVALWLILTPSRLTGIVNKLSDKFILCESHFGDVDLTIFKTFPYVGLNVEDVFLVNPTPGAPNDTVARIGQLSVGFNVREYLKNKNIEVTKLVLDDVSATLFADSIGNTNYDIFPSSDDDTTTSEPFEMPELVSLQSIRIKHLKAIYIDKKNGISANLGELGLDVDGHYKPDNIKAKVRMGIDALAFNLEADSSSMQARLNDFQLKADGDTKAKRLDGDIELKIQDGQFAMGGQEYVNDALASRKGHLLTIETKLGGDVESMQMNIEKFVADLKGYILELTGDVNLPADERPLFVDLNFATGRWGVKELLSMLPPQFTAWQKGMTLDATLQLKGKATGEVGGSALPIVTANLQLSDGKFSDRSLLPYAFTKIGANLDAALDLNDNGISNVDIHTLTATSGRNNITVAGRIDDLLGKMQTDATIKGTIALADAAPMLPDSLDMTLSGIARLNLHAITNMEQLKKSDFAKMRLNGTIGLTDLDVAYDTIYAKIPKATIGVQLPSSMKRGLFTELLSATLACTAIDANMPSGNINASLGQTTLKAAVSNLFDSTQPLKVVCDFDFASLGGNMDSIRLTMSHPKGTFAMVPQSTKGKKVQYHVDFTSSAMRCDMGDSTTIDLAGLTIKGKSNYDPSKPNILQQLSPNLDIDFKRGYIDLEQMDYIVQIPDIKFNYKPERCEIASANVVFGNSDFYLSGAVTGLEKWLSHEDMLRGDLYFTSNYTNVDDLLEAFSGMGSNPDTLEQQRQEDNVDTSAHPFIVPRDVNFTLHTRIKEATAFDNDLREIAGDVTINDGVAVLNQVGFVCKAARMQLTGLYRTPRVNHIFVGMDFHLLDINIQELIDMIPYVDTLVPLLNDLEGAADFHLCAETYVDAFYKPKTSTMRAATSLTGQNLVVLDNKNIDRIAKLLQLKKWREDDSKIHVDSLDVAATLFRNELEVYPFLLSLHKYQIVAEGRHNLSNNYDYHVELVQTPLPVRLAVDVNGTMPNLNFSLSPKLRYKNLFRPAKRTDVDDYVLKMKRMVRESLEANVKEDTRKYEGLDSIEN